MSPSIPLIVGRLVPSDESAWHVILDLKDIVELVVAPIHTAESIAYLDCKISEHRQRYQELFHDQKLLPTFVGPLVTLWTMRFEAKHSFFKQVVRHTNNFRNINLTLATKHQVMVGYNMLIPDRETHTQRGHINGDTKSPLMS